MAYQKKYGNKKYGGKKAKSKYTKLERFAYNLGKVQIGLDNPNSRVAESYERGNTRTEPRKKKPLL